MIEQNKEVVPSSLTRTEILARAHKRREELLDYIRKIGLGNLPIKDLAEKYGITERNIHNDISIIKKEYRIDVKDATLSLDIGMKNGYNELMKIIGSPDSSKKDKIFAIDVFLKLCKGYTDFLENFGIKETIVPRIRIEQTAGSLMRDIKEYKLITETIKRMPEEDQRKIRYFLLGDENVTDAEFTTIDETDSIPVRPNI